MHQKKSSKNINKQFEIKKEKGGWPMMVHQDNTEKYFSLIRQEAQLCIKGVALQ